MDHNALFAALEQLEKDFLVQKTEFLDAIAAKEQEYNQAKLEELVIPGIEDHYRRERARDELPQCGSGKTIMTSEPKFVPEEAVEISPDGTTALRVRRFLLTVPPGCACA